MDMISSANQEKLARFIAFFLFVVTICVAIGGVTDPVNTPKLLILGIFALASLGMLISMYEFKLDNFDLGLLVILVLFLLFSVNSTINSNSPLSQNVYGVYGRNNGLLTYIFLCIIFFAASLVRTQQNVFRILKGLIYAGCVNLAYCLWVISFGDFMPWSNTYGNILGTFGNPNFIGAFLGMLFGVLFALLVGTRTSTKNRLYITSIIPLVLFEIYQTRAIQGVVLVVISLFAVIFYLIKCQLRKAYLATYSALVLIAAGFGIAGGLQFGPLTNLIYKESISLRWQYWLAAWNTGNEYPLTGVGMDSFGDWYRRTRDIQALERPGLNVIVNTAHNVFLDMLAFGGWPLFLSYLILMGLSVRAFIKITLRMKNYDPVGVMLITAWICYQAQSVISINQIGLAVWGWALAGVLIGYERYQEMNQKILVKPANKTKKKAQIISEPRTLVFGFIFGVAGMLISIPPLSADIKLRSAQVSLNGDLIMNTTKSNYFNPANTQKFILNIQSFETAGLFDLAHQQAIQAVEWNPQSFELWRLLFLIKDSTQDEKNYAVINMKRLDPLNPQIESTK